MFRDAQQALGKIEHLPPLRALDPCGKEPRPAMNADLGCVLDCLVRLAPLAQRAAPMTRLAPARLVRPAAKAARKAWLLPQPVARRRLGARRAVKVQSPPKLGHLRQQRFILAPQIRALAPKRLDQLANPGRWNHPNLDSHFHPRSSRKIRPPQTFSSPPWQFRLTRLGSYQAARKSR